MRTNALSAFGRMGYSAHLAVYPAIFGFGYFVVLPWQKSSNDAAEKAEWDNMITQKAVDPDLFNPFTPIPFHNNPELKYAHSHIKMRNYINENHLNPDEYVWKNYHDSYDHGNKKRHVWNWA